MKRTMQRAGRLRIFEDKAEHEPAELTIEIAPLTNWKLRLREILGPAVLVGLSLQSLHVLLRLSQSIHSKLLWAYLAVFLFIALQSAIRVVWLLFGHEDIVLRGGLLTATRRIAIFGTARTFRVAEVKNIHVALRFANRFRLRRGYVAFSSRNRVHYIGDRISREEARVLVNLFRDWLPKELWTPVLGI